MNEVTRILSALDTEGPQGAEKLLVLVYDELRRLAAQKLAREKPGQTLQPTALVHEAYLRLVGGEPKSNWSGRGHFFAAAAEAMRRILIEQARRKATLKRGGQFDRVELSDVATSDRSAEELLTIDEALQKLSVAHPRKADLVKLRFFAGLSSREAAAALGVSETTAETDWAYARAWLQVEISGSRGEDEVG